MKNSFIAMQSGLSAGDIDIEMTDGWRGEADQQKALAAGNSRASFGHSPHNFGVAFDCAPVINGKLEWPSDMTLWQEIGRVGKAIGMVWGGDFHSITDYPHFEMKDWASKGLKLYSEQPPLDTPV